jgi:hypothetical protein
MQIPPKEENIVNGSKHTLDELIRIDREIEEMKKHPIDYSDIPPMTVEMRKTSKLHYKQFLDMLPWDIVQELARRRLRELDEAEYVPKEAARE